MNLNHVITSIIDNAVVKFTDTIDGLLLYQRGDRWHWELKACGRIRDSEEKIHKHNSGFNNALEALADFMNFIIQHYDCC
jgi:hypothetical protein